MTLRLKTSLIVLTAWLLAVTISVAQDLEETKPGIRAIAFAYSDSIAIRWAPTTPVTWQLANKYGYYIERVTITRNNKVIPPEKIKLFSAPLKPWNPELWDKLIDTNDFAAIAAQAIYGDSFESTNNFSSDVLSVISRSKELEQRYSFALLAADLSRITARASAAGFVDKNVKKNEKYVYKIYTAIPANHLKVDTGFVFTGVAEKRELPKPVKLETTAGDKAVMLSWPRRYHEDIYVAYRVERSENGTDFTPITKLPVLNTDPPDGLPADKIYKLDSLTDNNKKYFYRIIGLTPFGDAGPPSDVATAIGVKPFDGAPAIIKTNIVNNEQVVLQWSFPKEASGELKGFNILRSTEANEGFKPVNTGLVTGSVYQFTDLQPRATNYYKIEAIGKQDQRSLSFPYMVQLEDSIPPLPPQSLKASISDKGIVSLSWQSNKENDLFGYRVYRANYKDEEFSQITVSPQKEASFQDTVSIQTLTDKVYYKITAVDNRFNPSGFSEVLTVNRPDVLPPAPPVFTRFKSTENGIELYWSASPSEDVVKHELWRKDPAAKMDVFLKEMPPTDTVHQYVDVAARPGVLYEYVLVAYDDAGLKTFNAQPLRLKRPDTNLKSAPEHVVASADRTNKLVMLTWQYAVPDVDKIMIYRARGEDPITLFKSTPAALTFQDRNVEMDMTYRYRVQAVFKNGSQSKLSEEIVVRY